MVGGQTDLALHEISRKYRKVGRSENGVYSSAPARLFVQNLSAGALLTSCALVARSAHVEFHFLRLRNRGTNALLILANFSASKMGKGGGGATFCEILLAILLPPLGVFFRHGCGLEFWICILLTILGYVPGILYALYVIVA